MKALQLTRYFYRTPIVVGAICSLLAFTAVAENIKIGGTGNALGTMRVLAEAFRKQNPDIKVTVLASIGSSGAIKAIPRGAIDLGLSSRDLTDAEAKAGAVALEYARTPTVLAVSTKSKVTDITYEQIADIYSGKFSHWEDGTPTRPVLRQPGDDNTRQLKALSPGIEAALIAAEKRSGLPFAVTDQGAVDKIESIPGAIGVTSLALIRSEGRSLRPLTLENVEPTAKTGAAGKYPIIKNFFFITRPEPSAKVQKFIAFVNSPDGLDILTQTGHWRP